MVTKDDIHREIIEDALNAPESKPNKLFKWFLLILATTTLVAVLLAFLGGGQTIQFIHGRLESGPLDNTYSLMLDDGKRVQITEEVYNGLVEELKRENKEFKVCLIGEKKGELYDISSYYVPKIYSNSYSSVRSAQCSPDTLIPMHSHPIEHCVFSQQDILSYRVFKRINPDSIVGLMCGLNRFSFYSE